MTYAAEHADALAMVAEAGASVTFTLTIPGTYDAATDTWTGGSTSTVTGDAIRTRGNPERYKALELIESESPALLFTPDTYGDLPALNSTVSWNSTTYTVRDVDPIAPDGTAIAARVIVVR
jgi:hypothetical protein